MRVKSVKLFEDTITKSNMMEFIETYGIDQIKLKDQIRKMDISQDFIVETPAGDIKIRVSYDLKNFSLHAPLQVQEMFAKIEESK